MRLRVIFYAVNGLGLGHLTRLLGLARALRRQRPGCEILFLTSSEANHLVYREGFASVKLPSRNAARRGEVQGATFTRLGQSVVWSALAAFDPHALVVDTFALGSWQELGPVLRWPMRKVFVFRAQKAARARDPLLNEALKAYDLVLIPHHTGGDEVSPADLTLPPQTRAVWTGPMTLRGPSELLSRSQARAALVRDGYFPGGLGEGDTLGLVALGGGGGPDLGAARPLLARAIRRLQAHSDPTLSRIQWVEISGPLDTRSIDAAPDAEASTETAAQSSASPVPGLEQVLAPGVGAAAGAGGWPWRVLRDVHPMGSVLRAFDGAVAAAGYNTVQETQVAALPTLLWPFARDVDDQFARVRLLESQSRALAFDEADSIAPGAGEEQQEHAAAWLSERAAHLFSDHARARLRAAMLSAAAAGAASVAPGAPDSNGTHVGARAILNQFPAG